MNRRQFLAGVAAAVGGVPVAGALTRGQWEPTKQRLEVERLTRAPAKDFATGGVIRGPNITWESPGPETIVPGQILHNEHLGYVRIVSVEPSQIVLDPPGVVAAGENADALIEAFRARSRRV